MKPLKGQEHLWTPEIWDHMDARYGVCVNIRGLEKWFGDSLGFPQSQPEKATLTRTHIPYSRFGRDMQKSLSVHPLALFYMEPSRAEVLKKRLSDQEEKAALVFCFGSICRGFESCPEVLRKGACEKKS